MHVSSEIIEITGDKPGPTLAIFAGLHGNETAGVFALQELIPKLKITRGKIFIAYANPPAIEAGVRMVNKNMNRCFDKDNKGTDPEDIRAKELMTILDKSDALLDLHMFYDDDGVPFVICEDNAVDIAHKFDVDIISTNWDAAEPGAADGYMFRQGKIGICIECGPISKAQEYKDFSIRTIYQFLRHFDMSDDRTEFSIKPKRIVRASHAVRKSSANFKLVEGFRNFDKMKNGQVISVDGKEKYIAKDREYIIFPHYNARIGEEAFIVGTEQNSNYL
jgi:succinylglutamate desuccinylase